MSSFSESNTHPAQHAPRGNEIQVLIEHAHRLRAEETGRIMRKLFGLSPIDDQTSPLGAPLPKEG